MKTILYNFFERYIKMWKEFNDSEPCIPYDDSIEPILYIGTLDVDEYVQWLPKNKDVMTDFSMIEKEYNIVLNQDIKEYFNSYWFLNLQGFFKGINVFLEPVIPGKELDNFIQQLEGYYIIYKELNDIPIGFEVNNNNLIVINNITGKVYLNDLERNEKKYIARSLGDFIKSISFKK
ncbi:MAG: SecY-interacting protein Syd [Lachnospiraceae bacterium]|nr:SecY-interacting protein Syd [Lachnospiraceae bacterium]